MNIEYYMITLSDKIVHLAKFQEIVLKYVLNVYLLFSP